MPTGRNSLPYDRPLGWPAWCTSLFVHLAVLGATIYWLRPPTVTGAADRPTREAGIVLRKLTNDGPMFVDEEQFEDERIESTAASAAATNADMQMLQALPAPTEFSVAQDALPNLSSPIAGKHEQRQRGQAENMTAGAAPARSFDSKATVSVFGISGTGTRFVYVFDRSISMAGAPLRAAKQQLIASLDSLESIHQFQVIFFNHEPQAWDLTGGQNRIAFASDANKQLAEKFVSSVSATGGTFRRTALQLALRLRPDVIFFLTDTDDPMSKADLDESIRRAQRDTIAVNTIEYGIGAHPRTDNFLTQLASKTGGRYVYVDTQQLGR
ncbi:MAG: VWA domain-containing protein [Planctomycetota bacterium]